MLLYCKDVHQITLSRRAFPIFFPFVGFMNPSVPRATFSVTPPYQIAFPFPVNDSHMKYMKGQYYKQIGLDCILDNYNIAPEKILSPEKSWRVIGDGLACNIHLLLRFNIFLFTQMPFYSTLCFPQSFRFH